jgi:hypothetical protein
MRSRGGERDASQLVHDDEVLFKRCGQDPGQPLVIVGLAQRVHQPRRGVEADLRPWPAGRQC